MLKLLQHAISSLGRTSGGVSYAVVAVNFNVPCYTLSKKNSVIYGGIGSTSGRNFYMGAQNGSKLKFDGGDENVKARVSL